MKEEKPTKLTSFLYSTLMHAAQSISVTVAKKHFKDVKRMVKHYAKRLSESNPEQFIETLHKAADDDIKATVDPKKVSCSRGCSYCCYIAVNVSESEALLILEKYKASGILFDAPDKAKTEKRIEKQLDCKTWEDWDQLPYADRQCMFLQNNQCAVYEHRPLACRKYFVRSPADDCNSEKHSEKKVLNVTVNSVEKIASALINAEENGLLPTMINKVVQKYKTKLLLHNYETITRLPE